MPVLSTQPHHLPAEIEQFARRVLLAPPATCEQNSSGEDEVLATRVRIWKQSHIPTRRRP